MKLLYVLTAILLFGLLIAVHELGHFIAAKLCGVRVNEFSIGMGPLIFQRTKGETEYSLRALPVGGYCALEGEDEDSGDNRSFVRQGFFKKFVILAAGSFMNFVAGLLIIVFLFAGAQGFYVDRINGLAPEVTQTGENGLMTGDRIYKIDGYRAYLKGDASMFLAYADDTVDIEVLRDGRRILVEDVPRRTCTDMNGQSYQGFGLYVGADVVPADTIWVRLQYAWYQAIDFVQQVWFSLAQLVRGNAGMKDLSGPVGIVSTMTEVGSQAETRADAWFLIFRFGALLAVNLAVMNLLPIPAMDGGRIFFLLVDSVCLLLFKRKVPEKYQSAVNTAGFVILMGFMLLVTFQDVFRLFR